MKSHGLERGGEIIVPVDDLNKSREEFQVRPEITDMQRHIEAQEEFAWMRGHAALGCRNDARKHKSDIPLMRLLKASVIKETERMLGVTRKEILSNDHNKRIWQARRLVYWGLTYLMGCTQAAVARAFNHNYSTVCHGVHRTGVRYSDDVKELTRRCRP